MKLFKTEYTNEWLKIHRIHNLIDNRNWSLNWKQGGPKLNESITTTTVTGSGFVDFESKLLHINQVPKVYFHISKTFSWIIIHPGNFGSYLLINCSIQQSVLWSSRKVLVLEDPGWLICKSLSSITNPCPCPRTSNSSKIFEDCMRFWNSLCMKISSAKLLQNHSTI